MPDSWQGCSTASQSSSEPRVRTATSSWISAVWKRGSHTFWRACSAASPTTERSTGTRAGNCSCEPPPYSTHPWRAISTNCHQASWKLVAGAPSYGWLPNSSPAAHKGSRAGCSISLPPPCAPLATLWKRFPFTEQHRSNSSSSRMKQISATHAASSCRKALVTCRNFRSCVSLTLPHLELLTSS